MKRNPSRRLQTLTEKYVLSGDLVDAMELANEYLRTVDLSRKLTISDMEVASVAIRNENLINNEVFWYWLQQTATFQHTEYGEYILYIHDPISMANIIKDVRLTLDEPEKSIIENYILEAKNAGYKFLHFYV